jgi:hypothetical protein
MGSDERPLIRHRITLGDPHAHTPLWSAPLRRIAIAGLAVGGLGTAIIPTVAARQASPEAMATHPMVGTWLAITPGGPTPAHFLADGSFLASSAPISVDAEGTITYFSPRTGAWEP